MTYIKNMTEYLDVDESTVYESVMRLNELHRSTNNSQIARDTGLSHTTVGKITRYLEARSYLTDAAKGNAHHWRTTGKVRYVEDFSTAPVKTGYVWAPEHPAGHQRFCTHPSHSPTTYCSADEAEPQTMQGGASKAWMRDHPQSEISAAFDEYEAAQAALEEASERFGRACHALHQANHPEEAKL